MLTRHFENNINPVLRRPLQGDFVVADRPAPLAQRGVRPPRGVEAHLRRCHPRVLSDDPGTEPPYRSGCAMNLEQWLEDLGK
jgi:hypothetical protein